MMKLVYAFIILSASIQEYVLGFVVTSLSTQGLAPTRPLRNLAPLGISTVESVTKVSVGNFGGEQKTLEGPGKAGEPYIKCSNCSAFYAVTQNTLGERGRRVKCCVCNHTWFQSTDRVFRLEQGFATKDLSEDKISTIRSNLDQGLGAGGSPIVSKKKGEVSVFVGNLPFSFSDKDLMDLFKDYGDVISATIVKDNMDRSRGYGFVEMAQKKDGMEAMEGLKDYQINGRPITVRDGNSRGPPSPRHFISSF